MSSVNTIFQVSSKSLPAWFDIDLCISVANDTTNGSSVRFRISTILFQFFFAIDYVYVIDNNKNTYINFTPFFNRGRERVALHLLRFCE